MDVTIDFSIVLLDYCSVFYPYESRRQYRVKTKKQKKKKKKKKKKKRKGDSNI